MGSSSPIWIDAQLPPALARWLRELCGNCSNRVLQNLISRTWPRVQELLAAGEVLIEIGQVRKNPAA